MDATQCGVGAVSRSAHDGHVTCVRIVGRQVGCQKPTPKPACVNEKPAASQLACAGGEDLGTSPPPDSLWWYLGIVERVGLSTELHVIAKLTFL